jgi:alanine racemase
VRSPRDTLILKPRLQSAADTLRPTRAEIDLDAVVHNLGVARDIAGTSRVLAVVKADAYGHGVVPVARRLQEVGAYGFGVALAEEALELREAGIHTAIVVLNGVHGGAHEEVVAAGLTPVVYELPELRAFADVAARRGAPVGVHLKVDTGMSRLGVPFAALPQFLDALEALGPKGAIAIEGCMTHLSSADSDPDVTREQLARFDQAVALVRARGHRPTRCCTPPTRRARSCTRSRATIMVRLGSALFGYGPPGTEQAGLRPAMRLRTEIISLRRVPAGTRVGYDGTFTADQERTIATVPVGYGDGLIRATSNRAEVLVRGRRCPVVGNVSMDLTGIDVSTLPDVQLGDEVVLLGAQGGDAIDAHELARSAGTIHYEVLTNVSRRVPRFYAG